MQAGEKKRERGKGKGVDIWLLPEGGGLEHCFPDHVGLQVLYPYCQTLIAVCALADILRKVSKCSPPVIQADWSQCKAFEGQICDFANLQLLQFILEPIPPPPFLIPC